MIFSRTRWLHRFAVTVVCVILAVPGNAWGPLAHYELTRQAAPAGQEALYREIARYAQLPDYQPSYEITIVSRGRPTGVLSRGFCWGHAVIGDGRRWQIPRKPLYTDDGRYPQDVMWNLVGFKMQGLSSAQRTEMELVSLGWAAHNAADRVVHFGYFEGPDRANDDEWPAATLDRWIILHRDKEKWADYWVYIDTYFNSDPKLAFYTKDEIDALKRAGTWEGLGRPKDGSLKLTGDYAQDGVPLAPPSDEMVRLMQISQMAGRKSRVPSNDSVSSYVFRGQSQRTIREAINRNLVRKLNRAALYADYNRDDYERLEKVAENKLGRRRSGRLGDVWTIDDLRVRCEESKANIRAWLEAMRSQ